MTQVLIVGAGPSGLVLALWLAKQKISVRIIDKNLAPGLESRAIAVQARTLEFYQQLGIAQEVVAGGIQADQVIIRKAGKEVARAYLGEMGKGLSPFPYVLFFAQDEHEHLLIKHLEGEGVFVERGKELIGFTETAQYVAANIKTQDHIETVEIAYLCGCDGAHSTTRQLLGEDFTGGTYPQVFFVADVLASGEAARSELQVGLSNRDICIVMPVRSQGSFRLIGIVPPEKAQQANITFADVKTHVLTCTGLTIHAINWFSTYRIHHRIASHFSSSRVFLLGDAAHIHSPAGGQGMNTGIGDAVNLAWKLAAVIKENAASQLLESYAKERVPFAQALLVSTDKFFAFMTSQSRLGIFWRMYVFPYLISIATRFSVILRLMFKTISQIRVNYRDSNLSEGQAGKIKAGDRLPWVMLGDQDNFQSLQSCNWQVHIYGQADKLLCQIARTYDLPLHEFSWSEAARKAGILQNALYLVRPDGYIALADQAQNVEILQTYLQRLKLRSQKI